MPRIRIFAGIMVLALLSPAVPAAAQAPDNTAALQWTAAARSRVESWDWFDAGPEGRYTFVGSFVRAGLQQQRRSLGWRVEVMAPLLLGLPDDAVLPPPQGQLGQGGSYVAANEGGTSPGDVFPKEVYLRLGSPARADGHSLRVGRFDFSDGSGIIPRDATLARLKGERIAQRLLGPFGFTHVMRSYDGVQYSWTSGGRQLWLMGVRPTTGAFDTDGWGWVDDVSMLYGALTTPLRLGSEVGEARLFGLWYEDDRGVPKTDNRAAPLREAEREPLRITSIGGHLLQVFPTPSGAVDLLLWGALQTGRGGGLDHRGTAAALEIGIQPKLGGLHPWVRVGLFRGSGDGDPEDGEHETFFQVLPNPRPYARFPFYDLSNTTEVFGTLTLRPHPVVTVQAGAHRLRLSDAADLWYVGGGPFEDESFGYTGRPSSGATGLATIVDLGVTVSPVRWARVEAYLRGRKAHLSGGRAPAMTRAAGVPAFRLLHGTTGRKGPDRSRVGTCGRFRWESSGVPLPLASPA